MARNRVPRRTSDSPHPPPLPPLPEEELLAVRVTVAVDAVLPLSATDVGETVQVTELGAVQVRLTVPLNPPEGDSETLKLAALLEETLAVVGPLRAKSAPVPMVPLPELPVPLPTPVSATDAGKVLPLPLITSVPMRDPAAVGVKATPIVHDCPGEISEVQLFEAMLKSPLATGVLMMSVCDESILVTVTVCAALVVPIVVLLKVRVRGETESATFTPVPVSPTVCGLSVASSVIVNVPERVPTADGVKVTVIVQVFCVLVDAGSPVPQLFT